MIQVPVSTIFNAGRKKLYRSGVEFKTSLCNCVTSKRQAKSVKQCPPFSAALARRRRASRASPSPKEVSGEGTRVGAVGRRRTGGVEEDRGGGEDGLVRRLRMVVVMVKD